MLFYLDNWQSADPNADDRMRRLGALGLQLPCKLGVISQLG